MLVGEDGYLQLTYLYNVIVAIMAILLEDGLYLLHSSVQRMPKI